MRSRNRYETQLRSGVVATLNHSNHRFLSHLTPLAKRLIDLARAQAEAVICAELRTRRKPSANAGVPDGGPGGVKDGVTGGSARCACRCAAISAACRLLPFVLASNPATATTPSG